MAINKEAFYTDGIIVIQEGRDHAFILAAKFIIQPNVMGETDALALTKALYGAANALYNVVMGSIRISDPF